MALRTVRSEIGHLLTPSDWEVVDAFKYRADRLRTTRLATAPESYLIRGHAEITSAGISFTGTLPPEEVLAEHFLAFRFFVLEKEASHFERVLSVLGRHAAEENTRQAFRWFKDRWRNSLFEGSVEIVLNGTRVTAHRLFNLWFNGEYFHGDADKAAELRRLWSVITEPMAKYALVDSVINATDLVFRLRAGMDGLVRP